MTFEGALRDRQITRTPCAVEAKTIRNAGADVYLAPDALSVGLLGVGRPERCVVLAWPAAVST